MQGMRERAAEIGADLSIASSAAEGTRVSVYLSLSQKSSPEGNHRPVDAHQTK
jgi:nitrate/nitrite-specific signal transduction histidine kinase